MATHPYLRPPSVSLVCYLLIIGAAFGLFIALNVLREPGAENNRVVEGIALAVPLASGICGSLMLRGLNWARIVFFCVDVPLAITWLVLQMDGFAIFRLTLLAVYCIVLLRPRANRYFTGRDNRPARERSDDGNDPLPIARKRNYDY
jgi:hypothetical protein